jgi:hypothetical protein
MANRVPRDPVTVDERPALELPKPKPLTALARWKVAAAERQSPANRKAQVEMRWYPSRPGSWNEDD